MARLAGQIALELQARRCDRLPSASEVTRAAFGQLSDCIMMARAAIPRVSAFLECMRWVVVTRSVRGE